MILNTDHQRICVLFPNDQCLINFFEMLDKFDSKAIVQESLILSKTKQLKSKKYIDLSLDNKAYKVMIKLYKNPHKDKILNWLGYDDWQDFYEKFKNFIGLSLCASSAEKLI